jgi:hypothetical protein
VTALIAFLPDLFQGFLVNLSVAGLAAGSGLILGLPLALLRRRARWAARPIRMLVALLMAAPVYVIMFFLLNLGGGMTPYAALVLGQALNMVGYMETNGHRAIEHLDRNERAQALLFVPNAMRGFVVVCMSSGLGAGIGVAEAVGETIRHARQLPDLGGRLVLLLAAMALFASVFGIADALLGRWTRKLAAAHK